VSSTRSRFPFTIDRPFVISLLIMAALVGVIYAYVIHERDQLRAECEARGGHLSHGMVGMRDIYLCVEPDGRTPTVVVDGE
jgi:hypothetical protein